jgi:hypothetical protein
MVAESRLFRSWSQGFVAFNRWCEHLTRCSCVFFAHKNLKPCARPSKVLTHSSRRVTADHCLNARIFECTFAQVRFSAGTVRPNDNEVNGLHKNILRSGNARALATFR